VNNISRTARTLGVVAVAVTASLAFLECNLDPVAPYAPVIKDTVDYFEYTVPVNGVTTTSRYFWETTGTVAKVNLTSSLTGGTAILTIADDNSAVIFSHAIDGSGVVGTGVGDAGFWNIRVELTNAKGSLHFTVVPQ
jgi:hypothetical protein